MLLDSQNKQKNYTYEDNNLERQMETVRRILKNEIINDDFPVLFHDFAQYIRNEQNENIKEFFNKNCSDINILITQTFLHQASDISFLSKNSWRTTLLCLVCEVTSTDEKFKQKRFELVKYFIEEKGALIEISSKTDSNKMVVSAFLSSLKGLDYELSIYLITRGAKLDIIQIDSNLTPLWTLTYRLSQYLKNNSNQSNELLSFAKKLMLKLMFDSSKYNNIFFAPNSQTQSVIGYFDKLFETEDILQSKVIKCFDEIEDSEEFKTKFEQLLDNPKLKERLPRQVELFKDVVKIQKKANSLSDIIKLHKISSWESVTNTIHRSNEIGK